ncbi:MAG: hypothetical protein JNK61_06260 [Bacteroidia bacterium]|nr:hypothetical protein [Bacteroidia bacterium]
MLIETIIFLIASITPYTYSGPTHASASSKVVKQVKTKVHQTPIALPGIWDRN